MARQQKGNIVTQEPDPEIMDALYAHELLRDLEAELERDRIQGEIDRLNEQINRNEITQHIQETERLEAAGFEPVEVVGSEELIYERDSVFYSRAAALKEAR